MREDGNNILDLMQYITTLVYYAHNEAGGMTSKEFDDWAESSVEFINEFFSMTLTSLPEKRNRIFINGEGINDVLNFLDKATKRAMEIKDKGTSDERCVFVRDTNIVVELK